jgi:hypothetical protein
MRSSLSHFTNSDYWSLYHRLPAHVQAAADKSFAILKSDPTHPSLRLKKIGDLWSVRVDIHYRAIGMDAPRVENGILWFWIGPHAEYDRLVKSQ